MAAGQVREVDMRRTTPISTLLALSCAALCACTSSTPATPDAGANTADAATGVDARPAQDASTADARPSTALATLTTDAATAICATLFRCCDGADQADYFAPYLNNDLLSDFHDQLPPAVTLDEASCRSVLADMLDITPLGDWVAAATSGMVTFDGDAGTACLAALDGASCGEAARDALFDSTCFAFSAPTGGAEKRAYFDRTGATGASCLPIRDGVGAGFYGTCNPASHHCCYIDASEPELGCTYPFTGEGVARSGTCAPVAGLAQECTAIPPISLCATGVDCDYDSGTCVARSDAPLAIGSPCIDASFLTLGECVDSWCDLFGSKNCEAKKADDSACSAAYECMSGACVEQSCTEPTMCVSPGVSDEVDAGVADAGPADAGPADLDGGTASGSGETCADPIDLAAASSASDAPGYTDVVSGPFGASNDYNPLDSSGLPPGCSFVYDAVGLEVVYAVTLEPGETLKLRYTVTPSSSPGGLYILDSCSPVSWPDYDGSGACGNNEYASNGYCGYLGCDPLDFTFTHPTEIDSTPTSAHTYWVVLDEVAGAVATSYQLDWKIVAP